MSGGLGLIWAQARGGVIGADGGLPWHVPEDSAHFKEVTLGAAVVMGRRTWDSLPVRFRPLPGRRNIVLSRRDDFVPDGAERASSLESALRSARGGDRPDSGVWIVGGGALYAEAIDLADRLEVTELDLEIDGDTLAPRIGTGWRLAEAHPAEDGWLISRAGPRYRFRSYRR